jgi:membrane protease YdiL (CAAX protease family)
MSIPHNPLPPEERQLAPELAPLAQPRPQAEAAPAVEKSQENPPWTFWDVMLLATVAFLLVGIVFPLSAMVFVGTTHILGYNLDLLNKRSEMDKFLFDPRVALPVQLLGYLVLMLFMAWIVRARTSPSKAFFQHMSWHWPSTGWLSFVAAGAFLAILIQFISARLPIPHSLPIDKFFQTTTYAYLTGAFSILVAPFMEELFFRGFLYPALARARGMSEGVLLTSLAFMLVHGAQLSFHWAAMLPIFIVGLVLTLVRARTRSLAASTIIHVSYNATIFTTVFLATGGFRHMERL